MNAKKRFGKPGFALAYVIFMIAVIFMIGYAVIMMMRQEASSSFDYLYANIAHFVAETGVEHAFYVVEGHRKTDKIPILGGPSSLDINKKFGAMANFEMEIPKENPDDAWSDKLKSVNIETKIKEFIPDAKINFIKLKFEVQKKVDDNLVYGLMTISCQGQYLGVKRTAIVQKQMEVYRDLNVLYDHSFAVNNSAEEVMPARRKDASALSFLGLNAEYVPQYLLVNNGKAWDSDEPTAAKVFGRNVVTEPNEAKALGLMEFITGGGLVGAIGLWNSGQKTLMDSLNYTPMMLKHHYFDKELVDKTTEYSGGDQYKKVTAGAIANINAKRTEFLDSPMVKFVPRGGAPWGVDTGSTELVNFFTGNKDCLCEYKIKEGGFWGMVGDIKNAIMSGAGGSRGTVDFTGYYPPIGFMANLFNDIRNAIKIFGMGDKSMPNEIYGNILRRYSYIDKGSFGAWVASALGWDFMKDVETGPGKANEPYSFSVDPNIDATKYPAPPAKFPHLYGADVYKKIAMRHNIIKQNMGKDKDDEPMRSPIPHVFEAGGLNSDYFEDRKFNGGNWPLIGEIKTKEFKNVVWRPFWGWGGNADECPPTAWYNFSFSKNVFEAARQFPDLAINLDGVYFIDGDVLVEGFYRGKGVIVATGNVIVGGTLQRHEDDQMFDPNAAGVTEASQTIKGPFNCVQLIALGTRAATDSSYKVTGKIIFAPHAYDSKYYGTGWVQSFFSKNPQVRIDAFMYGENGMMMDVDSRKTGAFKIFSGTDDTFMTINGNFICEKLGWKDNDPNDSYPDKLMINKFQKWVDIMDEIYAEKFCTVSYSPKSDNFLQQRENTTP